MDFTVTATIMGIIVSALSLLTGIAGAVAWVQARTRKEYAAERDFGHLKRSYEALTRNVEQLWRLNDERYDAMTRQLDRIEQWVSRANGFPPSEG